MIIELAENWRLRSGPLQWLLQKRNPKAKSAQHEWKTVAFVGAFEAAVGLAARRQILDLPGTYDRAAIFPLIDSLEKIEKAVKAAGEIFAAEDKDSGVTGGFAQHAQAYWDAGQPVIPTGKDDGKKPLVYFGFCTDKRPHPQAIEKWLKNIPMQISPPSAAHAPGLRPLISTDPD